MVQLMQIVNSGVPIDLDGYGNLGVALAYGNHASTNRDEAEVAKIVTEARRGRILLVHGRMANVIQDLRISPLALVTSPSETR